MPSLDVHQDFQFHQLSRLEVGRYPGGLTTDRVPIFHAQIGRRLNRQDSGTVRRRSLLLLVPVMWRRMVSESLPLSHCGNAEREHKKSRKGGNSTICHHVSTYPCIYRKEAAVEAWD